MLCNFITSKIFQFSVYIFFLILSDIHMSIFAFLYSSVHNEVAVGSRQDRKMPDVHDQHGESILLIQWLSSEGLLHWFEHYKQIIIFLSTSYLKTFSIIFNSWSLFFFKSACFDQLNIKEIYVIFKTEYSPYLYLFLSFYENRYILNAMT